MEDMSDIFGGITIVAGALLYYWRNKRIFNRTNDYGIEQFPSYAGKVAARFGDVVLWFVAAAALLLGTVVLVQAHQDTWGGVVFALFVVFFVGPFFYKSK